MSIKAEVSFSLKDHLFNEESVGALGNALKRAHKPFKEKAFVADCIEAFPGLELKARIHHIVLQLTAHLPNDFDTALDILTRALPPPLDPTKTDDDFGEFIWAAPGDYAALHGCTEARLDRSLSFLRETTKRVSAENSIRPFLAHFPDRSMAYIEEFARDENYHVRRLASEGIRPFLPWSMRVALPTEAVLSVLDVLHADATRYVTRSVANTLNDISRKHPDQVIQRLRKWQRQKRQQKSELDWMARHALRTLIRADDPGALSLLGYPEARVKVTRLKVTRTVAVGENLSVSFDVTSESNQKLLIAMKVHFLKAGGKYSAKVFQIGNVSAKAGERLGMMKTVAFRPMTTRTLYPGEHRLEITVNGKVGASGRFMLAL